MSCKKSDELGQSGESPEAWAAFERAVGVPVKSGPSTGLLSLVMSIM